MALVLEGYEGLSRLLQKKEGDIWILRNVGTYVRVCDFAGGGLVG